MERLLDVLMFLLFLILVAAAFWPGPEGAP